ncbi:MAG TPA: hypothetical protein VMR44_07315 [Thermoanaerobaculia bacterium]|nr:hypothetical protein [Thermoanaerobaculia bacterium]
MARTVIVVGPRIPPATSMRRNLSYTHVLNHGGRGVQSPADALDL